MTTKRARTVAVLGPTNTGKTYFALERMLAHDSGMIGFPLRLLARENYERAVAIKGARRVALITGEEKIIPPYARYFFCTVESMPVARPVAFLGVDEIQLAADPDRGHVFTDRLLNARGEQETMFMGADSIRPLIKRLVPEAEFLARPRFSTLSYTGMRKIVRLPPRSAVVAFSAADVYAIAELIRRQRGGAAVVLGALSPRTRNAQVAIYQEGDVDYLVATDAIGMGLNMDVNHVAFADLRKFDGHVWRDLRADELAQIAGRAGRHMNDGTFGVTADAGEIAPETVERIENHQFDRLRAIVWRNPHPDFLSLAALAQSLAERPDTPLLHRVRGADDEKVLETLSRDAEIVELAAAPETVRLLWDVCQIPDFRKIDAAAHARMVGRIFHHLVAANGQLPTDWIAAQVARIDRTDGDIDTLTARIAHIRTWTYVAHRGDWLADPLEWQERTRAVEDTLSDALHERLTQRFVDHRTATLVKRLKDNEKLWANVSADGEVSVEGHFVGRLNGLSFVADKAEGELANRAVSTAAYRALRGEVTRRVANLIADEDDAFALNDEGRIQWQGEDIGRLVRGPELTRPFVRPLGNDLIDGPLQDRVADRLAAYVRDAIDRRFRPLFKARDAKLAGAARGLVFQLVEAMGSLPRHNAAKQIAKLTPRDFGRLRRLDVRIGREMVYIPAMLRPDAAALAVLLWSVQAGRERIPPPPPGRVSLPVDDGLPDDYYAAAGYRVTGPVAIRVDILERLIGECRRLAQIGRLQAGPALLNLVGCTAADMDGVLVALGYTAAQTEDGETRYTVAGKRTRTGRRRASAKNKKHGKTDGPFAKLKDLAAT